MLKVTDPPLTISSVLVEKTGGKKMDDEDN